MKIKIHRGLNEIGGTCIEIAHAGHRIILDLGIPLTKNGGGAFDEKYLKKPSFKLDQLPDINGLYKGEKPSVDAVLLSHAHMDHYGLMDFIHPEIPVYLSKDAKTIIEVGNIFWKEDMQQKELVKHCIPFEYWKPLTKIPPFNITPYLVDHSAYGACAFLIEAGGKKVFYTGDFRAHGRKKVTFDNMLTDRRLKNLDTLIIEGTTLGGGHLKSLPSENAVQAKMAKAFQQQNDVSFVTSSGSNIDRLVSLFKATRDAGKILVIDLYQYYLLCRLKENHPGLNIPPLKGGDHMRIKYIYGHAEKIATALGPDLLLRYNHKKIKPAEIIAKRKDIVLRYALSQMSIMANKMATQTPLNNALFIYSMWDGYLKTQKGFNRFKNKFGIPMEEIHTSGHAYKEDLIRFVKSLNPKLLIPVHTLNADEFTKECKNIQVKKVKQINL